MLEAFNNLNNESLSPNELISEIMKVLFEFKNFYLKQTNERRSYIMAKRVFFSFHYQDVSDFRANVVRNHWLTKPNREDAGYFDASIWETAKKTGDSAIKRLINKGLENTSTTVVLIGSQTYNRRWVTYEIMKSLEKGNAIIGIHINAVPDKFKKTYIKGPNPFSYLGYLFSNDGKSVTLHELIDNKWINYGDLDGYTLASTVDEKHRGKFYKLSDVKTVYDWIDDDGYNKFTDWIGD
jgi:hypothetical protein